MSKDIISIIVPCHNEEEMVPIFHKEIAAVSDQLPDATIELIFVNDGSKDDTLAKMKQVAALDERVHYLSFSRNFGKEAALVAGLRHATGGLRSRDGCGSPGPAGNASGNVCVDPHRRI